MKAWIYGLGGAVLGAALVGLGVFSYHYLGEMSSQECELKHLPNAKTEFASRRMSRACLEIYQQHQDLVSNGGEDEGEPRFVRVSPEELDSFEAGEGPWAAVDVRSLTLVERVGLYFDKIKSTKWAVAGGVGLFLFLFVLLLWLFHRVLQKKIE